MASVELRRSDSGWRDRWRAYRVFIDDKEVGRLRRGETARFDVGPNGHVVQLGIDWKRSAQFAVSGHSDEVFRFRCGPGRGRTLLTDLVDLFKSDENAWLFLEPDA